MKTKKILMQNIKKIILCIALSIHFQLTHSQQEQYSEFYNPEIYTYTKEKIKFRSKKDTIKDLPIIISDTITHDYFTTGKTRKLIVEITHGNTTIATIETWTTKNPSYATWRNAALISALATAAVGSGLLFYNSYYPFDGLLQMPAELPKNSSPTIQEDANPIIENEATNQNLPSESTIQETPTPTETPTEPGQPVATQNDTPTDTTVRYPLIKEWNELAFPENKLSPKQIQRKHEIEATPEFKKNLEEIFVNTIDFKAPDDKHCSFCTMLREAYGRTAEDNNIQNYFD